MDIIKTYKVKMDNLTKLMSYIKKKKITKTKK